LILNFEKKKKKKTFLRKAQQKIVQITNEIVKGVKEVKKPKFPLVVVLLTWFKHVIPLV